jgi:uncharacterized protein
MSEESKKKSNNRFSIELTTTQACNFKCEYCFENDCTVPDDNLVTKNIDFIINSLNNLFNDRWYCGTFDKTDLTFWGGEPTLNMKFINKIVDEFESNKNVGFYIYTNGSMMNELLPTLIRLKDDKVGNIPKFRLQISYDGNPIHDLRRKTKGNKETSEQTINAMEMLHNEGIEFSLKSTIPHKDFIHLPEVWNDLCSLNLKYNVNYGVTTDYHNIEIKKYWSELESSLVEIATLEYKFYKKNKKFLSNIFSTEKKFCSAGRNMLAMDIDGNLYPCHGACYSDLSHNLLSGNIFNDRLEDVIKSKYELFYDFKKKVDKCENCVSMTCLRCNVKKYEDSSKESFLDKWHDYTCQDELCLYYKLSGRIGRALIQVLKEEELWVV